MTVLDNGPSCGAGHKVNRNIGLKPLSIRIRIRIGRVKIFEKPIPDDSTNQQNGIDQFIFTLSLHLSNLREIK